MIINLLKDQDITRIIVQRANKSTCFIVKYIFLKIIILSKKNMYKNYLSNKMGLEIYLAIAT